MKVTPNNKKCKKKGKPTPQLKRVVKRALSDYNHIKNALPKVGNLRPRNPSSIKHPLTHLNYKFKVTRSIKKKLCGIKRTIPNEGPTQQNTNRISMNARIGNRGSPAVCLNFNSRFSSNFLENRSFKMANSSENSTNSSESFPKVTITFEQMLSIRKKRLDKKHQRPPQKRDPVVDVINQTDTIVSNKEQNDCFEVLVHIDETNQNRDVIEICDDSVIIDCKNNNMGNNSDIKHYLDETEKNEDVKAQLDGTDLTPEISKSVDQNISDGVVNLAPKMGNVLERDVFTINDSVNNSIISKMPSEETPNKMSIDDLSNQSVIIITPNGNNLPKPQVLRKTTRQTRWSSNNSIVTISDTSALCQDITDNDIIFVSEECQSTTVPLVKQRRLGRKSSVIVIEDDDSIHPASHRSKNRSKKKRRRKNKNHGCSATRTLPSSTITSELAGCADVNCVNAPNCNGTELGQPYACSFNPCASSVNPCLVTMPEQSETIAQNNHDSQESGIRLHIQNHLLNPDSANNKFGSNIHNAGYVVREGLRQIIIDGSNIALGHSNGRVFSVKGLQIAIDYFIKKGHKVKAFVPQYRLKFGQSTNPNLLRKLIDQRLVILTPSREVKGRRITPYDDRYIIQYATTCEGVVVSNDNYRDLLEEKPEWRQTIERRLLMYTWIDDVLIFPEDPLGRHGPNLSRFLKFP